MPSTALAPARLRVGRRLASGVLAPLCGFALGLGALAGCANPGASTAFRLGDHQVSMSQLEDASRACAQPARSLASDHLVFMRNLALQGLVGEALMDEHRLHFSDAQVRQALAETELAPMLQVPACAPSAHAFGRFYLASRELGVEKAVASIRGFDVEVNPRIGRWSAQELELVHTDGTLSQLSPVTTDPGRS